jgi:hypothetical protein
MFMARPVAAAEEWEDDDDRQDDEEPTVPCPYCKRPILEDTPRCPYCENYISAEDAAPTRKPWWLIVGVLLGLYAVYRWIVP